MAHVHGKVDVLSFPHFSKESEDIDFVGKQTKLQLCSVNNSIQRRHTGTGGCAGIDHMIRITNSMHN